MAPSAERNVTIDLPVQNVTPRTNVTFAVNYEVQLVDQFLAIDEKRSTHPRTVVVEQVPPNTERVNFSRAKIVLNSSTLPLSSLNNINERNNGPDAIPLDTDSVDSSMIRKKHNEISGKKNRRSKRDRGPREMSLARIRVRYDMQLVPAVKRNRAFLNQYPIWWLGEFDRQRHATRLSMSSTNLVNGSQMLYPFEGDSSVVWIPSKRAEWEDCVHEMTSVCTSAAIRRHTLNFSGQSSKAFHPPLSKHYIRDRVDIDDPIEGYQIRCKNGGWLQGFILFTNFTTWNHGFKWDSRHPMSGIYQPSEGEQRDKKVDYDGTLADELESQERSGEPQGTGIVFSGIAEIGLIGGLGCGEYLLRMALDRIYEKNVYKYVVLDAAEDAIAFYEEFGFIRVGSICRYGKGLLPPEEDTPFTGYRHWTHANESEKSLRNRGGPSYMMCLKLPCNYGGFPLLNESPPFLNEMMKLVVEPKPTIDTLGTSWKQNRRSSTVSLDSQSFESSPRVTRKSIAKKLSESNQLNDTNEPSYDVSDALQAPPMPSSNSDANANPIQIGAFEQTSTSRKASVLFSVHDTRWKKRKIAAEVISLPSVNEADSGTLSDTELSIQGHDQYHSDWFEESPKPLSKKRLRTSKLMDPDTTPSDPLESSLNIVESLSIDSTKTVSPKSKPRKKVSKSSAKATVGKKSKSRGSASLKLSKSVNNDEASSNKSYHSVRGRDGKFIPVRSNDTKVDKSTASSGQVQAKKSSAKVLHPNAKYKPIDRMTLVKQKVKSYPRNRPHFYNRVVKPISGENNYYFVLHYDEDKDVVKLVPMQPRGTLSGRREGRPRYQAIIGDSDNNFFSVPTQGYQVVNAAMIMKTPIIASEAWDIEDD